MTDVFLEEGVICFFLLESSWKIGEFKAVSFVGVLTGLFSFFEFKKIDEIIELNFVSFVFDSPNSDDCLRNVSSKWMNAKKLTFNELLKIIY